jgi:hypothetical protein
LSIEVNSCFLLVTIIALLSRQIGNHEADGKFADSDVQHENLIAALIESFFYIYITVCWEVRYCQSREQLATLNIRSIKNRMASGLMEMQANSGVLNIATNDLFDR